MEKKYAIGVHIGGNHISCAAVDLENRMIVPGSYYRGLSENNSSSGLILLLWATYIRKSIQAVGEENVIGIGFSMPGPFDYLNGIADFRGVPKYEDLTGIDISKNIENQLFLKSKVNIRYINDAIGFALGENWAGLSAGKESSVAVILGEGFGSAFIRNNMPVISGENVPPKGIVYNLSYKGKLAEETFSRRGLLNNLNDITDQKFRTIKAIANLAKIDPKIKSVFKNFGSELAEFMSPILTRFKPDICILGGEFSECFDLFSGNFKNGLSEKVPHPIEVLCTQELDYTFILGAAYLMLDQPWEKLCPILPQLD